MQAGASKSAMSKFGRLVPPPSGVIGKAAVKRALPQIADLYKCASVAVHAQHPAQQPQALLSSRSAGHAHMVGCLCQA